MRIRIVKDTKATFIATKNDSGAMNIETKEKDIKVGSMIGDVESISPNTDGTVDIHLKESSPWDIITGISEKAMEQHGDFPTARRSPTCCNG